MSKLPVSLQKSSDAILANTSFIPYGRQWIDESDIDAVIKVLKAPHLTQGPKVVEFEEALGRETNARYATAVNSGTSALHIACLAADIRPGDEVITSCNTFVASANCIVYCGAKPIFGDIDLETYNISPDEILKKINSKTKAVIPVHFAGQSCNMQLIREIISKKEKEFGHKIFIIEDASHALGSEYKGKKVGSCEFSDMTVMSFHPVKHITTAEGGAVLTNDESLWKRLKRFRSHGITSAQEEFIFQEAAIERKTADGNPIANPWYYEQIDLGFNYRITDIQCALGFSQLKKLPEFIKRRKEIVHHYNESFSVAKNLTPPREVSGCCSNFHLYVLLIDFEAIGMSRAELMIDLKRRGIQTQVHYIPVPTQPFYQKKFATRLNDFPNAETYYKKCLSIPLFAKMTDEQVEFVTHEILDVTKSSCIKHS